jgi:hypothetical protein
MLSTSSSPPERATLCRHRGSRLLWPRWLHGTLKRQHREVNDGVT